MVSLSVPGVVVIVSHAQNQPPSGVSQRVQLFSAGGAAVFRLDTQTGETTIYREGFLPANSQQYRYNYWQHIDDRWIVHDTAEEARQAQGSPR